MSNQLHLIAAPAWPAQKAGLLARPRTEEWIFELVHARTNRYIRRLHGIRDFEVTFNIHADIRSGGSCIWQGAEDIDWMEHRLRVHYGVHSMGESMRWTVGTFIVEAPTRPITSSRRPARQLQLFDMMYRLDRQQTTAAEWVGRKGTNIIERVRYLLDRQSMRHAIADSPAVFGSQMAWPATTTYLKATNEMLRAANFFSIYADPQGVLRGDPYRPPSQRGIAFAFSDDSADHPHMPEPQLTEDTYTVPSQVTLVASSDDPDALPMVGTALDTTSKFSFARRGLVISHSEQNVDAPDQKTIDAMAARTLEEKQRVSTTVDIEHLILPTQGNDVIHLRHTASGFTGTTVLEKFSFGQNTEGLCSSTVRGVAA